METTRTGNRIETTTDLGLKVLGNIKIEVGVDAQVERMSPDNIKKQQAIMITLQSDLRDLLQNTDRKLQELLEADLNLSAEDTQKANEADNIFKTIISKLKEVFDERAAKNAPLSDDIVPNVWHKCECKICTVLAKLAGNLPMSIDELNQIPPTIIVEYISGAVEDNKISIEQGYLMIRRAIAIFKDDLNK